MDTEAAPIFLQFTTVRAAERATVLSMGIPNMDIQVATVYKLTITQLASEF
jgi:hypothetical protein